MKLLRSTRRLAPAALVVATLAVSAAWSPPDAGHSSVAPPTGTARAFEVGWVRAHLDSVLSELPQHDVGGLRATQRARRSALLRTLKVYRDRGEFPRNYDFPGEAVPYFTDRKTGALCAVGYLLASTGRADIVTRVTRADNNVRVMALAGDTALAGWLDASGLTLAEAARIQVVYASSGPDAKDVAFLAVTPVALVTTLVTGPWNALGNSDGHRRGTSITGLVSGILAMGAGAAIARTPGLPRSSAIVSAGVGALGVAFAVHSMARHNEILAAARDVERKRAIAEATITPMLAMGGGPGAGLAVSIRF